MSFCCCGLVCRAENCASGLRNTELQWCMKWNKVRKIQLFQVGRFRADCYSVEKCHDKRMYSQSRLAEKKRGLAWRWRSNMKPHKQHVISILRKENFHIRTAEITPRLCVQACTRSIRRHTPTETTTCARFLKKNAKKASRHVQKVNQHSISHISLHEAAQTRQISRDECMFCASCDVIFRSKLSNFLSTINTSTSRALQRRILSADTPTFGWVL